MSSLESWGVPTNSNLSTTLTFMDQPSPEVDLFTAAWESYRTMVECDYLWHSLVMRSLGELVSTRFHSPLHFLDLACGDAERTTSLLQSHSLSRYTGVDRSGPALAIAARNVQKMAAPVELIPIDFVEFLEGTDQRFELIYVGLSAHHLGETGLLRFFKAVRRCLAPSGVLAAYEPFLLPDEVREDYVHRFCTIANLLWIGMTIEQRRDVNAHVAEKDFPLRLDLWNALAANSGLTAAEVLMKTPDRISMLVSHEAKP